MHVDGNDLKKILTHSGELLLKHFERRDSGILSQKRNRDILHQADLVSNEYIAQTLSKKYPGVSLLSEETKDTLAIIPKYRFVLDPLDGTMNFSRGIGEFGISLAFQVEEKTTIALVYKPIQKIFYEAYEGKGAFYGGKKLHVSVTSNIEEAVIAVDPAREEDSFPPYINNLHRQIRAFRSYGCAVQVLGYVAEGKIDAYIYDKPKIWDVAAMNLIIQEAGGVIVDHAGNEWKEGLPILASSQSIKSKILKILQ